MKKLSIIVIVMLFAVTLLSACSEAGIVGEWESVFSKEGEDYYYYVDMVSLELKKDNTAESESFDLEMRGTWEKDGNGYLITLSAVQLKAVLENEFLIVYDPDEDIQYYFVRDAEKFNKFPEGIKKHY